MISLTSRLNRGLERASYIRLIGRLMSKSQGSFEVLENYSISDENAFVRIEAIEILVHRFPLRSLKILGWMAENEHCIVVIAEIIKLLNNP